MLASILFCVFVVRYKKFPVFICGHSAWNKYFASAGHRVRQSALRAGHSQLMPVFCILKFENLSVIVTDRKRILSVTHEIMPNSDRWPAVISYTGSQYVLHLRVLNLKRGAPASSYYAVDKRGRKIKNTSDLELNDVYQCPQPQWYLALVFQYSQQ